MPSFLPPHPKPTALTPIESKKRAFGIAYSPELSDLAFEHLPVGTLHKKLQPLADYLGRDISFAVKLAEDWRGGFIYGAAITQQQAAKAAKRNIDYLNSRAKGLTYFLADHDVPVDSDLHKQAAEAYRLCKVTFPTKD